MRVETVGSPRDGDQVATLRTVDDGPGGFRLAATLPRYPAVEPTDVVVVGGRVRPRPDSDYGRYLERLGAWGSLDGRSLRLVPTPDDPGRWLERIRRGAGDALATVLPEPEAGLAAGILIGLRDRVDRDVAATFTTAGVSHIVAISGWNIAIVAAAVAAVAGGLSRRRRSIVTMVAIVAYIAFAGASPSVLRAGAMAGVVLFARETGRAGRAAAALGWAATILLVVDPGPRRRRRLPAVHPGDGRADRVGDAADGAARARRAGPHATLAGREPWCVAGRPGRHAADRPGLVRAARDHLAPREPRGRAARRPGDGGRDRGHGRWRARRSRGAGGRRRGVGRAGLGVTPPDDRDHRHRRRLAVGEHRVRAGGRDRPRDRPAGRRRGGPACGHPPTRRTTSTHRRGPDRDRTAHVRRPAPSPTDAPERSAGSRSWPSSRPLRSPVASLRPGRPASRASP